MLFVEVDSVEKNCKVVVDLEKVIEIAPLINGGCALFFSKDPMIDPARLAMNVKNGYDEFKQFVVQTVSVSDITKRIESLKQFSGSVDESWYTSIYCKCFPTIETLTSCQTDV